MTSRPPRYLFFSLSARILAVNVLALAMLAGGVLYLDTFRSKLIEQRRMEMIQQARLLVAALADTTQTSQLRLLRRLNAGLGMPRMQLIDVDGQIYADTKVPQADMLITHPLAHNGRIDWQGVRQRSARGLDQILEWLAGTPKLAPFVPIDQAIIGQLAELRAARSGAFSSTLRRREDGVIVISVAAPLRTVSTQCVYKSSTQNKACVFPTLLLTSDTRALINLVRRERLSSFQLFCMTLAMTLLLSIFLSRTIARPLRRLAMAAERVRLGRGRDVAIPRFLDRRDEVGELSRALSEMTQSLYERMDATERFAADVAHELKNPLASMRGALDILPSTTDPQLREKLFDVLHHDMQRMRRLITDISDASRLDAELSRGQSAPVDLRPLLETLVDLYRTSRTRGDIQFSLRIDHGDYQVLGIAARLAQVFRNIIDNAISFSPEKGQITVSLTQKESDILVMIEDEGPGVPEGNLQDIFKRFYSERPAAETFGQHSGLGLAIAQQIVQAHDGRLTAENYAKGARFMVILPRAG